MIYLSTFSRTIAPAVRIGYMILPMDWLAVFEEKAGFYSCSVSTFSQLLLYELPAGEGEESPDKTALEAAFTARQIKALVQSGALVTDGRGTRPMDYGDVAILLRSPNRTGGVYRQALLDAGVPVGSAQGSGFFTAPEISLLLAMLSVMDNPHKDIPLIAVLRSAAFGFTPDELSYIHWKRQGRATKNAAPFSRVSRPYGRRRRI